MARQKFYNIKATLQDSNGKITECKYDMSREEFTGFFFKKILSPKGFKVIKIEDIHEPVIYIR